MYDMKALYEAESVENAVALRLEHPEAQIIAGGSDVLVQMREGKRAGKELISIYGLDELRGVSIDEEENIRIGSLSSFSHITRDPIIRKYINVLGEAVDRALGSKAGIARYGFVLPMDDCRAMALIDFGGRIGFEWEAEFRRECIGELPTEMLRHFFHSFACAARCNLHVAARGDNEHHKAEAIFKAFARALRMAVARIPFAYDIPSSKGVL